MRYFGSKSFTANAIEAVAAEIFGATREGRSMCDPFGGIGMVASAFKRTGWRVTVADHLLFPHYYQRSRLALSTEPQFSTLLSNLTINSTLELEAYLMNAPVSAGWLANEYSNSRMFFEHSNALRISSTWAYIRGWRQLNIINEAEYVHLISSLVDSFDKVANTAGTYYAFLKSFTRRAKNQFAFRLIKPVPGKYEAHCYLADALTTVGERHFDVLYLDPPYSSRSYDRYYHLPQTIAGGVEVVAVGKSGVPARPPIISDFESPRTAERALVDLIDAARCSVLMVQYARGGLVSLEKIRCILSAKGDVREMNLETIGYTTQSRSRRAQHSLFVVVNA